MQTLTFSDDFSIRNQNLIFLLVNGSSVNKEELNETLIDSKLLVALFLSEDKKEMQQAMITLKDEKTYLLTFSNIQSISTWNSKARPLPISVKEISENVINLGIDGFIIDINEDHRFKVEADFCHTFFDEVLKPTYLNQEFRTEIEKFVEDYPIIESIRINSSTDCSAKIIFISKSDIADIVIEIGQKLRENERIKALAPQGLDLLVAKN